MKKVFLALTLAGLAGLGPCALAQDKAKTEEGDKARKEEVQKSTERKEITPLRVQVVFTEFEGEKKISNLPYTFLINADDHSGRTAIVRMGLRVPVATGARPCAHA